jgi:hypothetical protein
MAIAWPTPSRGIVVGEDYMGQVGYRYPAAGRRERRAEKPSCDTFWFTSGMVTATLLVPSARLMHDPPSVRSVTHGAIRPQPTPGTFEARHLHARRSVPGVGHDGGICIIAVAESAATHAARRVASGVSSTLSGGKRQVLTHDPGLPDMPPLVRSMS